eukprot:1599910-Rhodomonas_salina.2
MGLGKTIQATCAPKICFVRVCEEWGVKNVAKGWLSVWRWLLCVRTLRPNRKKRCMPVCPHVARSSV